mgnify:CR=1 FL=1
MRGMNLEQLIQVILNERKDLTREDLLNLIDEKIQNMGGLITEEVAAYIIARDLGIELSSDELLSKVEVKVGELKPKMNNVIVVGSISEIINKGRDVLIKIVDDKGNEAFIALAGKWKKEINKLRPGRLIRIVSGYIRSTIKGIPVITLGKESRLIILRRQRIRVLSEVKGVIVKTIGPILTRRGYMLVVVLKKQGMYSIVRVYSETLSRLNRFRKGIYIRAKLFTRDSSEYWGSADDIEVLGEESVKDEYYDRILDITQIKSGLRYIDVRGNVMYVGIEKEREIYGKRVKFREVILGSDKAAIKLKAWGELANKFSLIPKGSEVIVKNVNANISKSGLEVVTTKYSMISLVSDRS